MKFGHLIHIGYPKSASNALRRWFAAHPQLDYAERGIAGARDIDELVRKCAAPASGIRYRVTSAEALAAPHPAYGDPALDYRPLPWAETQRHQQAACAMLNDLFPNAHILMVTRGFRDALRSDYSQWLRVGGRAEEFAALHGGDFDAASHPRHYDLLIGLYRAAFDGRVIVLPYELYRDDAEGFVTAIERRLGLDHHPPPRERVNVGLSPAELRGYAGLNRIVRALPLGRRWGAAYAGALRRGRLGLLARLAVPASPLQAGAEPVGEALVERFRGLAESLRAEPAFRPYWGDYLLDAAPDGE